MDAFALFHALMVAWEADGHNLAGGSLPNVVSSSSALSGTLGSTMSDGLAADNLAFVVNPPAQLDDDAGWHSMAARFANFAHERLGLAGRCLDDDGIG